MIRDLRASGQLRLTRPSCASFNACALELSELQAVCPAITSVRFALADAMSQ